MIADLMYLGGYVVLVALIVVALAGGDR